MGCVDGRLELVLVDAEADVVVVVAGVDCAEVDGLFDVGGKLGKAFTATGGEFDSISTGWAFSGRYLHAFLSLDFWLHRHEGRPM